MSQGHVHRSAGETDVLAELEGRLAERFPEHPFDGGLERSNFEDVAAEFLSLSIAFPYIQAGAIYETYRRASAAGGDTDENAEVTAAIGSFLVWDELGGHQLVQQHGEDGLLQLTNVDRNFHSHLLRRDLEELLGREIHPRTSPATREYLDRLLEGLSDATDNRNVAHMIAFEAHAHQVIESLWKAVSRVFDVPMDSRLKYFYDHVGGDAPAEEVHMEMTQKMLRELVPEDSYEQFLDLCVEAYALSIDWASAVTAQTAPLAAR